MTRYHKPIDFCSYNIETVFDEMPLNAESVYHLTVDLLGFRLIPIMNGEEPTSWDQIDELEVQARDCLLVWRGSVIPLLLFFKSSGEMSRGK